MTNWSPTKFHPVSGRYYRYQESGQTIRLLDASVREALDPDCPASHHHYFKINGRWYVYADTPNHSLFRQPTAAGIDTVSPSEHLDQLVSELKRIEPLKVDDPVSDKAKTARVPKRTYRGVVY